MAKERNSVEGLTVVAIAAVILLPLLYMLGIGPLAWLASRGYVSGEFVGTMYYPLAAVCLRTPLTQDLLGSYIDFWVRLPLP